MTTDPSKSPAPAPADGGGSDGESSSTEPEQIAADLFHRVGQLDELLQRSQDNMIALLDGRLDVPGAPAADPSPASVPDVEPAIHVLREAPTPESQAEGESADSPESDAKIEGPKLHLVGEPVRDASSAAPEPPPVARRRPAWLSNLLTLAVTAALVVIGMLLIGLF